MLINKYESGNTTFPQELFPLFVCFVALVYVLNKTLVTNLTTVYGRSVSAAKSRSLCMELKSGSLKFGDCPCLEIASASISLPQHIAYHLVYRERVQQLTRISSSS